MNASQFVSPWWMFSRPYRVGAEQRKDVIVERSLGPGHPGGEAVAQNQLEKVGKSWPQKTPGRARVQLVECTAIQTFQIYDSRTQPPFLRKKIAFLLGVAIFWGLYCQNLPPLWCHPCYVYLQDEPWDWNQQKTKTQRLHPWSSACFFQDGHMWKRDIIDGTQALVVHTWFFSDVCTLAPELAKDSANTWTMCSRWQNPQCTCHVRRGVVQVTESAFFLLESGWHI